MTHLVVYMKNGTNHAVKTTKDSLLADLKQLQNGMAFPHSGDEDGAQVVFILEKIDGRALIVRARDIDYIEQNPSGPHEPALWLESWPKKEKS